jgi:hypothetical protein
MTDVAVIIISSVFFVILCLYGLFLWRILVVDHTRHDAKLDDNNEILKEILAELKLEHLNE